jgi:hypothetical protein
MAAGEVVLPLDGLQIEEKEGNNNHGMLNPMHNVR